MADIPKYLEKIVPFFKPNVDFSKINKPTDILKFEITSLKVVPDQYKEFFDDMELVTIEDLARAPLDLEIEGIDPEELKKIAMIAEMIFWKIIQISEMGARKKKIVLFGLDNAGKTSMLTALSEKYSSIKKLLPTRGLVRQSIDLFGYTVMSFDMGGQKNYRETYFQKADMYFGTGGDVVLYCIDVQDPDRYNESLEYFGKILDTYRKFDLKPPIMVVFTKYDPDLLNDENISSAKIDLMTKIDEMAADFDIAFASTSIFERNSIEQVFSQALKRVSTSGAVIQEMLQQFCQDINAYACALVSSSGLIYGSFGITDEYDEMLTNSASYIQNLYLFHLNQGLRREEFYQLEYKMNNLHFLAEFVKELDNGNMIYLWVLTSDLRTETLRIDAFKEELKPLIDLFL